MHRTLTLLACLLLTSAARGESIWIEGEHATTKQVTPHGWYNGVKLDVLSGEAWLSHFDANREGRAAYQFKVETAGEYTFWIRANHVNASLSYRLGGGEWVKIDLTRNQRGAMNIARDNKPDLRFISWVNAGQVKLPAGEATIEFRMDSGPQNHGAIDCFCFTNERWVPSGVKRPDAEPAPAAPGDWFAVVLDRDPLDRASAIDVSHLIEAPAGKHGFLKADGRHLRLAEAEQPIKFWGVNAGPWGETPEDMQYAARWFRKHGVNLVRQHTMINAVGLLRADGTFDAERLDRYDRWFAALKQEGIYTTWSVLYPHHGAWLRKSDGYDAELFAELDRADGQHDGNRQAIVVNDFLNLDRKLQDIALRYFEKLLTHKNPYTGLAYHDDPALAIVEFQNESNVFFHTLNGLRNDEHPHFSRKMRRAFFEFVQQKYATREAAAAAWGNRWDRRDNWEAGELGLMAAYHWGSEGPLHEFAGQERRAGDYIEFLAKLQREYYTRREQEIRQLGFRGVTVTTAWKAGGPAASMANLYCDTAADMIDRHNYFGGGDGGHRITEGAVDNRTHLSRPGHGLLSLGLFQVANKPFCVSEWSMLPPAPYKAEAAPLIAFYGVGLQGWDAVNHFATGAPRMGDGWPELGKYVTQTPHYIGQFPALAMAIHRGHIAEGEVIATRVLNQEAIFSGRDVLGQALSAGEHDAKELAGKPTTSPELLAIGRVEIAFGADQLTRYMTVGQLNDVPNKALYSRGGPLAWHYGQRRFEVRSEKTQAVVGFPGSEPIELPDVTARIATPFVSLIFTPLDDAPLADSRRILITAMARDKQTGAEYNDDWSQLITVGGPPLLMEPVQATLRLAGGTPARIQPLDGYGLPLGQAVPVEADGSFTIDGRYRAYYYEVTR